MDFSDIQSPQSCEQGDRAEVGSSLRCQRLSWWRLLKIFQNLAFTDGVHNIYLISHRCKAAPLVCSILMVSVTASFINFNRNGGIPFNLLLLASLLSCFEPKHGEHLEKKVNKWTYKNSFTAQRTLCCKYCTEIKLTISCKMKNHRNENRISMKRFNSYKTKEIG